MAVNAADLAPVLVSLGATIRTTRRRIPAEEFFAVGPRATTVLSAGELVREVEVPLPAPGTRQCYLKYRTRRSIDFPIAGVAAVVTLSRGVVRFARLALGAAAPIPLRATGAEEYLVGRRLECRRGRVRRLRWRCPMPPRWPRTGTRWRSCGLW